MITAEPPSTAGQDDPTLWRVDDALWAELQPLLVIDKPRKKPGRPRNDDRAIFDGLIWLDRTGSQWAALPRAFGAKSTVQTASRNGSSTAASSGPGRGSWRRTTARWAWTGSGSPPTGASSRPRWGKSNGLGCQGVRRAERAPASGRAGAAGR